MKPITTNTITKMSLMISGLLLITSGLFSQALFDEHIILEEFHGATCIAAADFDADGDIDLVATANSGHKVSWFEQAEDFQFIEHVVVTGYTAAKGVISAQIDNNDSWDIVATAKTLGRFSWFSNDGSGNFTEHIINDTTWSSADFVFSGDIDSDSDQDLILVSCGDNRIAWAENNGDGNFTVIVLKEDWTKTNWATITDLDQDGDQDIVATAKAGEVIWFENDGAENFTEIPLVTGLPAANSVQVADFDSDGDMDLVVTACDNTDLVAWYENDGAFGFTEHLLRDHYNGARASKIADLDQDGDTDILSIAWQTGIVNFWENDGAGNFSGRIVTDDAYDMIQVYVTDLDLDGDPDILGACFGDHELRWWESINTFLIPDFKSAPQSGQQPLEVQFTDQTYAKPPVHTWQWDFNNDGIIDSQEQHPEHFFETVGNYPVKLIVTSDSITDSIIRQEEIRVFDGESSLEFNGSDSRLKCQNDSSLNLTGNFTIEAWVKPTGFGSSGAGKIIDKTMISFYLNQDLATLPVDSSFVVMMAHAGGVVSTFSTPGGTVKMNQWQHLALSYDTVASEAHVYLDGVDQPLEMITSPMGPVLSNSTREFVVGNMKTGNHAFQGCIDEVRIWNSIRSETEIEEWMEMNLPDDQQGLHGYWKFDEGAGDTAFDRSGADRHGELSQVQWMQGVNLTSIGIRDMNPMNGGAFHLAVYPNPLTTTSRIFLTAIKAGIYRGMLFSSSGKEITKGAGSFPLSGGVHEISWDRCMTPGISNLLPGIYLLCFQSGILRECCKVVVP
ncbi:MAG: VCBS repeat-containing protein [Bacteroidales bacterium]|nr:VCBS repeat-containing protein [Bacteroidales bacterium]